MRHSSQKLQRKRITIEILYFIEYRKSIARLLLLSALHALYFFEN